MNAVQPIEIDFLTELLFFAVLKYSAVHDIISKYYFKYSWIEVKTEFFNLQQYQYFSHLCSYIYQRIHFVFEYFHVANMRIKFFADVAAMSRLLHFISRYTQNGSQQQHTAWSRFYFSRWFIEIVKFISNLFGYCNILGPSSFLYVPL